MIPIFPEFKILELDDRELIENFTKHFPPYNDFEFIDLWIYNPKDNTTISNLNNNLVIKRQDYTSNDFFYTFLGTNNAKGTIQELLSKSKEENLGPQLKHIPEISISSSELENYFSVTEDEDNFDYILSIDEISELQGSQFHEKRNMLTTFMKLYPNHSVRDMDLSEEHSQQEIKDLFFLWEKQKGQERSETEIELIALKKLFSLVEQCKIHGLGIYENNKLIGFATYHMLPDDYAGMSFEKGDKSFKGIYVALHSEAAKRLKNLGAKYLNYEQDLGIPGLKHAKKLWRPVSYLKKYTVTEK